MWHSSAHEFSCPLIVWFAFTGPVALIVALLYLLAF